MAPINFINSVPFWVRSVAYLVQSKSITKIKGKTVYHRLRRYPDHTPHSRRVVELSIYTWFQIKKWHRFQKWHQFFGLFSSSFLQTWASNHIGHKFSNIQKLFCAVLLQLLNFSTILDRKNWCHFQFGATFFSTRICLEKSIDYPYQKRRTGVLWGGP